MRNKLLGINARGYGFTLIELILVMVIMGVILGISVPQFSNSWQKRQLSKNIDMMVAAARWAQAQAIAQQEVYVLTFDDQKCRYRLMRVVKDKILAINSHLGRWKSFASEINCRAQSDKLYFFADGQISPWHVELTAGDEKVRLSSEIRMGALIRE